MKLPVIGFGATVSVAAFDCAVSVTPHVFVKTARYWLPLCATVGFVRVSVVAVSPFRSFQVAPLFVLTCHLTDGAGLPPPAAVNDAFAP